MTMWWTVGTLLPFVALTSPTGHRLYVNPAEVSSVREPLDTARGHWAPSTRCVLIMSNGLVNGVREDCLTVDHLLEGGHP